MTHPLDMPDSGASIRSTAGQPAAHRFAATGDAVLLVEDERAVSDAMRRILTTLGYETHVACSADEALERLEQRRYDLLLCDVRLPETSGVALVQSVLARHADLAIVMLSGMDDALTATRAMQAGALDYLTKPVERDALAHALQRALRVAEQRRGERAEVLRARSNAAHGATEDAAAAPAAMELPMPPLPPASGIPLLLVPETSRRRRSWPRRVMKRFLRL